MGTWLFFSFWTSFCTSTFDSILRDTLKNCSWKSPCLQPSTYNEVEFPPLNASIYIILLYTSVHAAAASSLHHTHSPLLSLQHYKTQNFEKACPSRCKTLSYSTLKCLGKLLITPVSASSCGSHDEGNSTECVICLGAVTLCFYGNPPPGVKVIFILQGFFSPPLPILQIVLVLIKGLKIRMISRNLIYNRDK